MLFLKKRYHEKKYYITDGYSENDVSSLVNTNTIFNVDCSGLIVNGCYCLILSVIVSLQSEEMLWLEVSNSNISQVNGKTVEKIQKLYLELSNLHCLC